MDPTNLEPADVDPRDFGKRARKGTIWANDGSISPLDLYCYLKARFGRPNGLLMLVRNPSSDNLIQWHYSLRSGDAQIEVYGHNSHLEIMAGRPDKPPTVDEIRAFALAVKADFARHGKAISEVRKSLERWILFVNPFARIEKVVTELRERLLELDFTIPLRPSCITTKKELDDYSKAMRDTLPRHFQAQLLGLNLRMLVPVMAEAFINLVFFCLAKPEVRRDDRLYDGFLRNNIDLRLASLHMHCDGFPTPINREAPEVKRFLQLMNRRNDLLHGNVDPQRLKFDEVFFDGTIPLFKDEKSMTVRFLENSLRYIEPEEANSDVIAVAEFITFLLQCMDEEHRKAMEVIMYEREPGWRPDTNRIGLLFSENIAEFFIGGDKLSPESEAS
jgi:hypothetical protein